MARPKKAADERRDDRLPGLRLTAAERAFIEAQATAAGIPWTEYARRRLLGMRVAPARSVADDRAIVALNRVGVLLNQIARALHTDRPEHVDLALVLGELRQVLGRVAADGA